jgi:hypothetical protein
MGGKYKPSNKVRVTGFYAKNRFVVQNCSNKLAGTRHYKNCNNTQNSQLLYLKNDFDELKVDNFKRYCTMSWLIKKMYFRSFMLLIYPIFTIFFIVILNPERARSDTEQNFFISAEEAKTYGIIDRVVDKLPSFSQP